MAILSGCTADDAYEDPLVARAFDQELRWSDLRQVIPMDLASEDSASLAQAYVNNWLRQQVVLNKAEANLSAEAKDFETQLRDYRHSLILFAYEQALVDQKLDTAISAGAIEEYYQSNGTNFELKDHVVRARWFHVEALDRKTQKRIAELFLSDRAEHRHELELWLAERGSQVRDRSNSWTFWSDMVAEMAVDPRLLQSDAPAPGKRTIVDEERVWFLEIMELRPRNSAIPLELVRNEIRAILINQRKLQLIERMREDLYREALENKEIEVR